MPLRLGYPTLNKILLNNMKIGILLTSTFYPHNVSHLVQKNPVARKHTYLRALEEWTKTDFPIVLIDNSETSDLIHILTKNVEILTIPSTVKSKNKGEREVGSILDAITNSVLFQDVTHIIKVTGRYYIPNFRTIVDKIPSDIEIIHQQRGKKCEVFGFKKELAENLFDNVGEVKLERHLYRKRYLGYKRFILPQLPLSWPTPMGGRREIRTYL